MSAPISERLPERRSRVACRQCGLRKVRCNVMTSGRPCANCELDQVECVVLPRKRRLSRKQVRNTENKVLPDQSSGPPNLGLLTEQPSSTRTPPTQAALGHLQVSFEKNTDSSSHILRSSNRSSSGPDEGDNTHAIAAALDVESHRATNEPGTIFYSGAKHGAVGFINDVVGSDQGNHELHYLVPRRIKKATTPDELTFLRSKGAFSLPSKESCDELIKTFFHHIYPLIPILDANLFLEQYVKYGCQNINLLLLWSMLLAAANFVDPEVLAACGYRTRKGMKRAMYQRAKALYDTVHEEDQICLLQSVILIGFWYTDAEDRFEAWHWVGIAISLAQTLGLHRKPQLLHDSKNFDTAKVRLLRRIWWSCFVRDRWLSLHSGRPMRINAEDCDVPWPTEHDILDELRGLPATTKARYIPFSPNVVGNLWCSLVNISIALGNIVRTHYSLLGPRSNSSDVELSQKELSACVPSALSATDISHPCMRVYHYQIRLFYEAATVVLYRPYILTNTISRNFQEPDWRQFQALEQAKEAASNTNAILEKLMSYDLVKYLKPMTITIILPPMQIHLLECKSSVPSIRRLGYHKLDLGMMVLSELRETYWGADFVYQIFEKAKSKLQGAASDAPRTPNVQSEDFSTTHMPSNDNTTSPDLGIWMPTLDDLLAPDFSLGFRSGTTVIDSQSLEFGDAQPSLNTFVVRNEFEDFLLPDSRFTTEIPRSG